jgi:MoaA/NifB/PqqE/SkfB family radical SAM enzyme
VKYTQKRTLHEFTLFHNMQPLLSHIDIELTERCNNACIHCYINQPEKDPILSSREMDTHFFKAALQQAADLGCLTVRFTGGEPLLREDFTEIFLFARRLGLRVTLFTNARLITPELAGLFKRTPPGQPLEVSVYGMRADSYDAVAAKQGAFEEFWRGILLLQEHRIPFIVKQSLLPQNRDEILEFETFAASLPDMDLKPGYAMNFDLRARRDNPAKNRFIKGLRITPEETVAMLTRDPEKFRKEMREFADKFMFPPGEKLFNCGAGYDICIDAYGNAQMCMLLRHPDTVYPLRFELEQKNHPAADPSPLKYALTEFFPRVRSFTATNPEYLRRCALCFLKGLCEQCPAKSWEEHGTLDTPVKYLCQVAHAQARYLGLVLDRENAWELIPEVWLARLNTFTVGTDA